MGRFIDTILLLSVFALVVGGLTGIGVQSWTEAREASAFTAPGTRVGIGDRAIHLDCRGEGVRGRPTVVLEAPLMATTDYWRPVQDLLVSVTRTCSYDRAGLGFSDPRPASVDTARDLQGALKLAGIDGPFVLVGAEEGAVHAQILAALNETSIAAMVLIDPVTLPLLRADDWAVLDELTAMVASHRWAVEVWAGRHSLDRWIEARGLQAIDSERLRWHLSHRDTWRAGMAEVNGLRHAVYEMLRYPGQSFAKPVLIVESGRPVRGHPAHGSFARIYANSLRALARDYPRATVLKADVLTAEAPVGSPEDPLALSRPVAVFEAVSRALRLVAGPQPPASEPNGGG